MHSVNRSKGQSSSVGSPLRCSCSPFCDSATPAFTNPTTGEVRLLARGTPLPLPGAPQFSPARCAPTTSFDPEPAVAAAPAVDAAGEAPLPLTQSPSLQSPPGTQPALSLLSRSLRGGGSNSAERVGELRTPVGRGREWGGEGLSEGGGVRQEVRGSGLKWSKKCVQELWESLCWRELLVDLSCCSAGPYGMR